MLLVTGYPILYAIWLSLQKYDLRFPAEKEFVGLSNYRDVLTSRPGGTTSVNTVIITVLSVAIELVLGMLLALVMHRAIFGRGPVRTAILIPYGIVTVVAAFAWLYAFTPTSGFLGIFGTTRPVRDRAGARSSSIIVTEVWKTTPFMALLLLAGLALVPDELHEAAKVDGASAWQRFWQITMPLMKPAILVALLFRTLDAFRIFDTVFIQNRGANGTETVSILGYNELITRLNLGLGSAISVLIFICVIADRVLLREGARRVDRAAARRGPGMSGESTTTQKKLLWAIGILFVLLYALIPVLWLVVAVAQDPATIGTDKSFLPHERDVQELPGRCSRRTTTSCSRCVNSFGIAAISTLISIVLAAMAAYALARLDFAGKTLILSGRARDRDVPADLDRRLAVRAVAEHRPVRHLARPDHPVHDVHAAARDLHAVGVLQRDPVGARTGGPDGRRHAVPGVHAR